MKVNLVNYEKYFNNGILTKYSEKLAEALKALGVEVSVSAEPDEKADVNYHINYASYQKTKTIDTLMVTHITTPEKLEILKQGMKTAKMGICMSKDTELMLRKEGLKELCTILPAHDGHRKPKVVALLTNVYPDGCKREWMFTELVKTIDKRAFVFLVMGKGWQPILEPLVKEGLQVQYFNAFDYKAHMEILARADHSLYLGEDEGSMGILDSASCGLKLIAPNVGFHKEIGIDYPFSTQEELNEIFKKLSHTSVEDWTWEKYAKEHLKVWKLLLSKTKMVK